MLDWFCGLELCFSPFRERIKSVKVDYRVVSGLACYWIQTDPNGIIIDAAPIARAWIGSHLNIFRRAFPKASVKRLKE